MEIIEKEKMLPETTADRRGLGKNHFLGICILLASLIISGALVYISGPRNNPADMSEKALAVLEKAVLPEKGIVLPVSWGSLGKQMVDAGVIDKNKFEELYASRGGLDSETRKLLEGAENGRLKITRDNSGVLLNLLWALGLGNKNDILDKGPMTDRQYGGDPSRFASTGGWTLANGKTMGHYSRHNFIVLSAEQQSLVENVSKNIFRPCCNNHTNFPDCNHGMAMLGLLELMASQGAQENDMYRAALWMNSFWFPDHYLNIAQFLKSKGIKWKDVSPKGVLSSEFSSYSGYQKVLSEIQPVKQRGGSSCGA